MGDKGDALIKSPAYSTRPSAIEHSPGFFAARSLLQSRESLVSSRR